MKAAQLATASGKPLILSALGSFRAWFHYRDRIGPILRVHYAADGIWEGDLEAAKGYPIVVEGADSFLALDGVWESLEIILGDLEVPPDLRDAPGRRSAQFWRDERNHWRVIAR